MKLVDTGPSSSEPSFIQAQIPPVPIPYHTPEYGDAGKQSSRVNFLRVNGDLLVSLHMVGPPSLTQGLGN